MADILIVDDDTRLRQSFAKLLAAEGHETRTASTGEDGVEMVSRTVPDLVIQDVRLPGMDGLETFKAMRKIAPGVPVIIMTAYGTTDLAIEAAKRGAFDYVVKPFDIPYMLELIAKALAAGPEACPSRGAAETEVADPVLVGQSPAMQELYKAIGRAAPTDATVLILGESGTGKELVAQALHRHSRRSDQPFLVINCVAIPETLLESELFGYEKGAFTGASHRRAGKIEQANRGTVFLDEIGDMPPSIQAKILRLLQERTIERLGGGKPVDVDVRILAATNRNLEEAVAKGNFREDLYYRLKVVTLELPPLTRRQEDIVLLAKHFLDCFSREMGLVDPGLKPEAETALVAHHWPGNVRELGNVIRKMLIFNRNRPISLADVQEALREGEAQGPAHGEAQVFEGLRGWIRGELRKPHEGGLFESFMDRFGSLILQEALMATGGNRTRAAKLLGLSRPTLLSRMEKYGLRVATSVEDGDADS